MPRHTPYLLQWSVDQQKYVLFLDHVPQTDIHNNKHTWLQWLGQISSFAFQGRSGERYTIRKEKLVRGSLYWYAYRFVQGHTLKRYLGRTEELTLDRLEATKSLFPQTAPTEQLLLQSKFHLPHLPSSLILRTPLLHLLDSCQEQKLTLITAPAGFGKTTLVQQWLSTRKISTLAWLSLDENDNDPARFWRYLITACQHLAKNLGQQALKQLAYTPPQKQQNMQTMITSFINDFSRQQGQYFLVLDDYHAITEDAIHQTLLFLLENLPPNLHVLLLTRSEPPFPLVRWRLYGELAEFHTSDLRFTSAETAHFLQQFTNAQIPDEIIDQLEQQLEGWAAGLRLLSLSLPTQTNTHTLARILETLAHNRRPLLDYFVHDVLAAQPKHIQRFLLQTSILNRFNYSLCQAVTGEVQSEALLKTIVQAGLFLDPLEEPADWYRYYSLFAEAMRTEALNRFGEAQLHLWYRLASNWYAEQGLLHEAIEAALQAHEYQDAGQLIRTINRESFFSGRQNLYALRRWLERLPQTILYMSDDLIFTYAMVLIFISLADQFRSISTSLITNVLHQAEVRLQDPTMLKMLFVLRAMLAYQEDDHPHALLYAQEALDQTPEVGREQIWFHVGQGIVGRESLRTGQIHEAKRIYTNLYTIWEQTGNTIGRRGTTLLLAEIAFTQGELRLAFQYYQDVYAKMQDDDDLYDLCRSLLGLAEIFYAWNDLPTAQHYLQDLQATLTHFTNEEISTLTSLLQARLDFAQQKHTAALQHCTTILAYSPRPPWLIRLTHVQQARFHLATGNLPAVERWLTSHQDKYSPEIILSDPDLPFTVLILEHLLRSRYLLTQARPEEALSLLNTILQTTQEQGLYLLAQEIQLVTVYAHKAMKNVVAARQVCKNILWQAENEGQRRLFLDEGLEMQTILQAIKNQLHDQPLLDFLHSLSILSQESEEKEKWSPAPLSPQELKVLHLLAAGKSNPEIARELVVTVNTVKAQVRSIYRKLDVNNRVEASKLAQSRNLL